MYRIPGSIRPHSRAYLWPSTWGYYPPWSRWPSWLPLGEVRNTLFSSFLLKQLIQIFHFIHSFCRQQFLFIYYAQGVQKSNLNDHFVNLWSISFNLYFVISILLFSKDSVRKFCSTSFLVCHKCTLLSQYCLKWSK